MDDSLIAEFENLKISALSKSKAINDTIHNVTLGPNSTVLEETTNVFVQKKKPPRVKKEATPKRESASSELKPSPVNKMLVEIESQRRDEIEACMRKRIDKMQGTLKEMGTTAKTEWIRKQQMLIEESQRQEQLISKVLAEHEKQASEKRQQDCIKRKLEAQLKEKQQRHLLQLIEAVQKQQCIFRAVYYDIHSFFKDGNPLRRTSDPAAGAITMNEVSLTLKTALEDMDNMREKCKAGTVVTADLERTVTLVREAAKMKDTVHSFLKRKLADDQRLKFVTPVATSSAAQKDIKPAVVDATDTTQPPTVAATQASVPVATPSLPVISAPNAMPTSQASTAPVPKPKAPREPVDRPTGSIVDGFASKSSLKLYSGAQQFLETYKQTFAQLAADPRLKQFRFHCQKAVNLPLNAISAVSPQHLMDKYQRLTSLLKGKPVEAGGTTVESAQHPQGIAFCTDLLAKKFVLQGDLLISSNPESAHCYAAMIVALWHEFPDFGRLVLAYFYQAVPYLAPFYPPKLQGQSDPDYYRTLGYHYVDGVIEKQDKFLKRMSGIVRLYAAITISRLKRSQQGTHPHGLKHAWRWLASVLNLEPQADITATLLFEFLEITGSAMLHAYSVQFHKLLHLLQGVYLPRMLQIDSGGPVCRLEVLMQRIKKTSQIEPPRGRLAEGFW